VRASGRRWHLKSSCACIAPRRRAAKRLRYSQRARVSRRRVANPAKTDSGFTKFGKSKSPLPSLAFVFVFDIGSSLFDPPRGRKVQVIGRKTDPRA